MTEQWLPVVGFEELYEVSSFGRVRNSKRGSILSPRPNPEGYHRVALSKEGRYHHKTVHRLVLEAFVGPAPEGKPLGLHGPDDDPSNNRVYNLRWGSPQENMDDKMSRGRARLVTQCVNEHEYTEETTYINPKTGHRSCKICRYNHTKASQERRRAH